MKNTIYKVFFQTLTCFFIHKDLAKWGNNWIISPYYERWLKFKNYICLLYKNTKLHF